MNRSEAPESARIKAAEVLLNRAHGLPKATLAGDPDNPLLDLGGLLASLDRKTRESRE